MNCPFTPFMVLFCHAIATADVSDLNRLGEFVSSLQSASEVAEGAEKLCRLCHVFHRVAELYIHAKLKQQSSGENQQVASSVSRSTTDDQKMDTSNGGVGGPPAGVYPMDDLEPYLSALGFPNATAIAMNGDPATGMVTDGATTTGTADFEASGFTGDSMSLGDWFAGNVNIMSLLETDLSNINPGSGSFPV
jgi:hypothetical protein